LTQSSHYGFQRQLIRVSYEEINCAIEELEDKVILMQFLFGHEMNEIVPNLEKLIFLDSRVFASEHAASAQIEIGYAHNAKREDANIESVNHHSLAELLRFLSTISWS
jgi:hypothetical protein